MPSGFFCFPTRIGHMRHRMTRERMFPNLFLEEYRMASSCNGCFGGLTFPDFVQQRCCNPCCRQTTGSVGGTSTTNPTCTCTCTRSCSACSAAIASMATSSTRNSAAPHHPEPHGTEAVDRRGQNTAITTFRSTAQTKGPGRSIFEEHSRTGEGQHS